MESQLDWNDVRQVRDRLILLLRLCHLCRSVDLQRCCRRLAAGCWLQLRRKGALRAKFERLLELQQPAVSPLHVAKRYVELTAGQVPPGGALFCSLFSPYKPLSANALGSITKTLLKKLGVPMLYFGPQSTRGAGVKLYKSLGWTSEQVCELG